MGSDKDEVVEQVTASLDALAAVHVAALDDAGLRGQLVALLTITNRVQAELVRRVDGFERRGLAAPDGFRTARAWLQAAGRLSGHAAGRVVKAARLLRDLPELATAAQGGEVSGEQVQQVARLADEVGVAAVGQVEATLAEAAGRLDPARFGMLCQRVQAHLDPDGPDPAAGFAKRGLTIASVAGMLLLRGQLDAEGGAALSAALAALQPPPAGGDQRSAAQRRADALVELARQQLAGGALPAVGGQRLQVGVLLYPQALSPATLARLAQVQQDRAAAARLREFADAIEPASVDWARPGVEVDAGEQVAAGFGRTSRQLRRDLTGQAEVAGDTEATASAIGSSRPAAPDAGRPGPEAEGRPAERPPPAGDRPAAGIPPVGARPAWSLSGWADPPWLEHIGAIPPAAAQRIACDADIWRLILDPATGVPLDVGRAHRLVPHGIRKALHARDRGCRWPGCTAPVAWTDAHHVTPWAEGGKTSVRGCVLLCRHHHMLVHEGGWGIDLDLSSGQVTVTRPGGLPYTLPRTRSRPWNGPTTQAV